MDGWMIDVSVIGQRKLQFVNYILARGEIAWLLPYWRPGHHGEDGEEHHT